METQQLRVIRNSRRRRQRKTRRLLTMTVIITSFIYMTYSIHISRRAQLNEVRVELAHYQHELEEVMLRQGFYENQVIRLEDEDYIAMLARELYFRSLPNEIIFRLIDVNDSPLESFEDYEYQNEEYNYEVK